MGNSINKIDEGFYIGGVNDLKIDQLQSFGIRCILNVAQEDLYSRGKGNENRLAELKDNFEVKIIGIDDKADCNLSVHFQEIADFIEAGRSKGGVVVHCQCGVSRSCAGACSYLMIKENWDLESAFCRVQSARSSVKPNRGFWRQLRDLEASLKAQGVQFKKLPDDYTAPEQPNPEQEAKLKKMNTTKDGYSLDPVKTIKELDEAAKSMETFVTQEISD